VRSIPLVLLSFQLRGLVEQELSGVAQLIASIRRRRTIRVNLSSDLLPRWALQVLLRHRWNTSTQGLHFLGSRGEVARDLAESRRITRRTRA
jgi:hypothetical protein